MKIYYNKYKHSKAATAFSICMSWTFVFLGIFVICFIVYMPITALLFIPACLAVQKAAVRLEMYIARRFPDEQRPGIDIPAFEVTERDYQRAMRIISLSVHSREMKELAKVMGKTPAQTMEHFEEVVRNYNLARYSEKNDT